MATNTDGGVPVPTNSPGSTYVIPRAYRRKLPRFTTGRLVWGGLLRVLQRITHYKHGDRLEFKIAYSVRDLVSDKSHAVKGQVEALVHAVQPLREAAHLGRSTVQQSPATSSLDDPEGTQPRDAG